MPAPRSHFVTYRLQWLLCAFVALLLAITLKLTLTQVTDHYQSDTLSTASRLKSQFQQMETFLEAMRGQAEERLRSNPQSALTQQLYGALRENGDQGFALDKVPANLPKGLTGPAAGPRQPARRQAAPGAEPLPPALHRQQAAGRQGRLALLHRGR